MRVDWSSNKIVSAYSFDPLAALQLDGEELESLAYRVDDPNDPDAPVFESKQGYLDVTNKIYIKPHTLGGLPACYYYASVVVGGMAPFGSCDPAEVKLRHSFLRNVDHITTVPHLYGLEVQSHLRIGCHAASGGASQYQLS
jgi:hypothetical protein